MFKQVRRYCIGGARRDTTFCVLTSHESHTENMCDGMEDKHWVFVRCLLAPHLLWQGDEG